MSADKWQETYKPVFVHPLPVNGVSPENLAPWGGTMFETYGPEQDVIMRAAIERPRTVWTLCDDGATVVSGFFLVNRLGHFITEVPFKRGQVIIAVDKEAKEMSKV